MQRLKRWRALILLGAVTPLLGPWPVSAQRSEAEQKAEDVQKQAEEAQRALDIFLREQRVLFKRGELALELGLFYSQDTNDTFLRSGPDTVFAKLTKRTFIPSLTLRYGLVNDIELDLLLPFYGYAEQKIDVGTARLRMSDAGLGDIAGLVRYQVWHERGSSPDIIVDVGFKSRTAGDSLLGTGNWSIGGGSRWSKPWIRWSFSAVWGTRIRLSMKGLIPAMKLPFWGAQGFR